MTIRVEAKVIIYADSDGVVDEIWAAMLKEFPEGTVHIIETSRELVRQLPM